MHSLRRPHDIASDAWSIGRRHEFGGTDSPIRFDGTDAAAAWLGGFEPADLRRVLLDCDDGAPLQRLSDHDVVQRVAHLLADGSVCVHRAGEARPAGDERLGLGASQSPADRLARRLQVTGQPFSYNRDRLRLASTAQWQALRDRGEARYEVVARDHALPALYKLQQWPDLSTDERRALQEAQPLLTDARAPQGADGIVLLRNVARTAAVAPRQAEPASTPSQAAAKQKQELHWIRIELVDDEGEPVPDEPYEIELPDGTKRTGKLDKDGQAYEGNIQSGGQCRVCFTQIDGREWRPA